MLSGNSVKALAPILAIFSVFGISAQKPKPLPDKDGVYAVWNGVTAASLLHAVPVVLPADSNLNAVKHACAFLVIVNADGSIRKAALANRTPSPFDNMALNAVNLSTFQSGTLDGNPVPTQVMIYVPFLADGKPAMPISGRVPGSKPQLLNSLKPPVPISPEDAELFELAQRVNYQGMITVRVLVDEEGLPRSVGLLAGAGRELDEKALATFRKYKFKPATLEGMPVPFLLTIQLDLKSLWSR